MKVIIVVGARPNFIKAAPLIQEIKKHREIQYKLIHTGQHYDERMSGLFFKDLKMPKADINLGVGGGSHAEQTAAVMVLFEKICQKQKPDLVIVFGDINSTLACALAAAKLNIKIAHIEAGLRSLDRSMPEEINRILTDHISDYLFVTEQAGVDNLIKEGISKDKIFLVGNIMTDNLKDILKKKSGSIKERHPKNYCVVTLHRPANVDDPKRLKEILNFLDKINTSNRIVWPLHPRTKKNIKNFKIIKRLKKYNIIEPLGYLNFINLLHKAQFIISDSGGVQAEASYLQIPCLILRETTEHLDAVLKGTNILINTKSDIKKSLAEIKKRKKIIPKYWDGKTAKRIINYLIK